MKQHILILLFLFIILVNCQSANQKHNLANHIQTFTIDKQYMSKNYNSRIRQIILHYTAGEFGSLKAFGDMKRQVSSHHLINNIHTQKNAYYI